MNREAEIAIMNLENRVAVLENLVAALVAQRGVPTEIIDRWMEAVANRTAEPLPLTDQTVRLVETVRSLTRPEREDPTP